MAVTRAGRSGAHGFTLNHGMKNAHMLLVSALSALLAVTSFAQDSNPQAPAPPATSGPHPNGPTVVMDTSLGRITCQVFQKQTPRAVANFIGLAKGTKDWTDPVTKKRMHNKPLYDGTTFHRVLPDFMIQGGDPSGNGKGDPGYTFADEFAPGLNFDVAGRLAMANAGPNTNGSQFFITAQPYPSLNRHYTIFGQCDEPSVSVVLAMTRVARNHNDRPLVRVMLNKVTIVPEGRPLPPVPSTPAAK